MLNPVPASRTTSSVDESLPVNLIFSSSELSPSTQETLYVGPADGDGDHAGGLCAAPVAPVSPVSPLGPLLVTVIEEFDGVLTVTDMPLVVVTSPLIVILKHHYLQ